MPTQELYESQDFGGTEGVVYQDTNGIAIKIPSSGLDEDGFINSVVVLNPLCILR